MRSPGRVMGLAVIGLGLVMFGVGALLQSGIALGGIFLSSVSATWMTWRSFGRKATLLGLSAGLVAGVVAGLVMRTMMRLVALTSDIAVRFTIGGTLSIVATGLLMSVLPALGYLHLRQRMGVRFGRVVGYAAALTLVTSLLLWLVSNEVFSLARNPFIPIAFFLGVPFPYVAVLEGVHRWANRH